MLPLGLLLIGGIIIYSGIHGYSLPDTLGIALGRTPTRRATNPSAGDTSLASDIATVDPVTSPAVMGGDVSGASMLMDASGLSQFDGHPVASWIIPILTWARIHGWRGVVSSGYRTPDEQMRAATHYGLYHYGPAGPLGSNHVGYRYPKGAVDVTEPEQLYNVLRGYPGTPNLKWGGLVIEDAVHFSATGQ